MRGSVRRLAASPGRQADERERHGGDQPDQDDSGPDAAERPTEHHGPQYQSSMLKNTPAALMSAPRSRRLTPTRRFGLVQERHRLVRDDQLLDPVEEHLRARVVGLLARDRDQAVHLGVGVPDEVVAPLAVARACSRRS